MSDLAGIKDKAAHAIETSRQSTKGHESGPLSQADLSTRSMIGLPIAAGGKVDVGFDRFRHRVNDQSETIAGITPGSVVEGRCLA
jgi:hypothetical protein